MFKFLKDRKKDNKGFTLVELVIVVAILAILVGILAPQYTKYVEKSRKAADAANLDNLVTGVKVAAADGKYDIVDTAEVTYTLAMTSNETTLTKTGGTGTDKSANIKEALNEYAGTNWGKTTLKSKAWGKDGFKAVIKIAPNGSVTVTYTPEDLKNNVKED